jgi:hypothetical protein
MADPATRQRGYNKSSSILDIHEEEVDKRLVVDRVLDQHPQGNHGRYELSFATEATDVSG